MNTSIPFVLHQPGMRDPVNCLRSFLAKIKALAFARGDHGSTLEHNVLGKFVDRETALRNTAGQIADEINQRLIETHEKFKAAVLDGVVTAAERRALEKRFSRIESDARGLGAELIVPDEK